MWSQTKIVIPNTKRLESEAQTKTKDRTKTEQNKDKNQNQRSTWNLFHPCPWCSMPFSFDLTPKHGQNWPMRSLFFYTLQLLIGGLQTSPVPQILIHFSPPATRPLHYPPAPPVTPSPTKPVSRSSLPPGLPVTPFFPHFKLALHFSCISMPFHFHFHFIWFLVLPLYRRELTLNSPQISLHFISISLSQTSLSLSDSPLSFSLFPRYHRW